MATLILHGGAGSSRVAVNRTEASIKGAAGTAAPFKRVVVLNAPASLRLPVWWRRESSPPASTIADVIRPHGPVVVVAPLGCVFLPTAVATMLEAASTSSVVTWEWRTADGFAVRRPGAGYKTALFCWNGGGEAMPPRHLPEVLCEV